MATTTNYSWTTPDDTALVKDGAAAIRSLGTSIDTTTKNLNPSTTLGDIEYRSSTANTNTRLAIGSTGNVLTVAGGVPTWAAPAGGGKVLQVVNATLSTAAVSTSNTFADTGLTASITPSSASSKILVLVNVVGCQKFGADTYMRLRLLRGATEILLIENQAGNTGNTNTHEYGGTGCNYLDAPATTSSTTYKLQFANDIASGFVRVSNSNVSSTITLMEIGA
jgi:hypothetical protein